MGLLFGFLVLVPEVAGAKHGVPNSPPQWLLEAVNIACPMSEPTGLDVQTRLPGSWLLEEERQPLIGTAHKVHFRLGLPNTDELFIERRQLDGRLRQFRASYYKQAPTGLQPRMLAIADGSCEIHSGRRIHDGEAPTRYLDQLAGDLRTVRWSETLQAPWPSGRDPGGVRVGLVDSGLAYDLALFRDRLARDASGRPVGHDYWDLDPYPYDGDTSRGPFLPIRHGTAVASVLVREAPDVALVPYRYPRPDMERLGDLVKRAIEDRVRILAMPLGSRRAEDWTAFANALRGKDILAIASAGNDGRDIDRDALWPAALDLENMIVVTSSDAFGRLADGSNWGPRTVDIMLPAENVGITDFRGASGTASGSSYAVPRLAAMAVRILAAEPGLHALDLKARILARATPRSYERKAVVGAGWIPDPLAD